MVFINLSSQSWFRYMWGFGSYWPTKLTDLENLGWVWIHCFIVISCVVSPPAVILALSAFLDWLWKEGMCIFYPYQSVWSHFRLKISWVTDHLSYALSKSWATSGIWCQKITHNFIKTDTSMHVRTTSDLILSLSPVSLDRLVWSLTVVICLWPSKYKRNIYRTSVSPWVSY